MNISMAVGLIIVALIVGLSIGYIVGWMKGDDLGAKRIREEWTESLNTNSLFSITCPICNTVNRCEKGKVRKHLEATKPWIACSVCDVSLIQPYMQHEFVKKAREKYVQLVENNKTMRAILNEPYHPITQVEEEAIREEVRPLPEMRAANQMLSLRPSDLSPRDVPNFKRKRNDDD